MDILKAGSQRGVQDFLHIDTRGHNIHKDQKPVANLPEEFGIQQACSNPNGQSNCGDIPEQDGRYSCKGPVRLSSADMAVRGLERNMVITADY